MYFYVKYDLSFLEDGPEITVLCGPLILNKAQAQAQAQLITKLDIFPPQPTHI